MRRGQVVAYIENTQIVELQRQYLTAVNELSAAKTEPARQQALMKQDAGVLKTCNRLSRPMLMPAVGIDVS